MKSGKRDLMKPFLILLIVSAILSSCSKDDETPGLFGTWTSEGEFDYEGYELDFTQELVLSEESYDIVGSASHFLLGTHQILGFRGPLEVDGDSLFFTVEEAGYAEIDESTFSVGPLIYYQSGDPEYLEALELIEGIPLRAKYEIEGGTLTIIGDSNDDGDANDEFETTEFTK